jgi:aconitate hydratase
MIAIGVGGADAVDVLVGLPFNLRAPKLIGVRLTGKLSGWSAPKDVILRVADILTVKGGTGAILEYFGPGAATISATGKATICNMGAEIGATTSVFGCDDKTIAYLRATGRDAIADLALANAEHLQADPEVDTDPARYFDQVIEIDLSTLKPLINGPATPDLSRPVDQLGADAIANDWPIEISAALIGSCTNSSYEDITRTASIARQAAAAGLRVKTDLLVTPGSERVRATIERDGLLADLEAIGATVLANACGPCIGQWQRDDVPAGTPNVIVTSYNRNFPKRNDGRSETLAFVTSPETVMAYALVGRLDFDPTTDAIDGIKLDEPVGIELPSNGFVDGDQGFAAPSADGDAITVVVSPDSDRLQLLTAFDPWDGEDFVGLPILAKAIGKCTTDHISPAGPWLKFRGHLENISMNLFSGAINAYTGEAGFGADVLDSMAKKSFPEIARDWSRAGQPWVFVADENYGEGSSREHAAMEPRFRGARAIIARSFARIAETNLKKQGVLPLFFEDRATYDLINVDTRISILGLQDLTPDVPLNCELLQGDGSVVAFRCTHTFSPDQIDWFRAGGALNLIRQQFAS